MYPSTRLVGGRSDVIRLKAGGIYALQAWLEALAEGLPALRRLALKSISHPAEYWEGDATEPAALPPLLHLTRLELELADSTLLRVGAGMEGKHAKSLQPAAELWPAGCPWPCCCTCTCCGACTVTIRGEVLASVLPSLQRRWCWSTCLH